MLARALCLTVAFAAAGCIAGPREPIERTQMNHLAPGAADRRVAKADGDAGNPEERICTTEHVTGSNIPRRVCRTRSQKAEEEREGQELIRRAQIGWQPEQAQ